ncbi:cation:proton antiporter [Comamonas sp.]|uniref:cation:proton antiporter domain-containing protein n=1 Tax=Comamonas sp. TaxID=34028 RepID=UPI003A9492F1
MHSADLWAKLAPGHFPALLSWCVLVGAAALLGHMVHRVSGFPRMLGYTAVGLVAGWLGFGDLPWPLRGNTALLLEIAVGTSVLVAASQISLRWLFKQPWLLLQSLGESLITLGLTAGLLVALGWGWPVALAVGVIAMAASPAVLLRIAEDLRASGAVTDRSVLLATVSSWLALLAGLVLTASWVPVSVALGAATGAEPAQLTQMRFSVSGLLAGLYNVALSLLWAALLAAALWPVLRWKSSRSDTTALYLLAALAATCLMAEHWGGSAVFAFMVAGLLLRNLSAKPLLWPQAFQAANAMLNLVMFVLVASMAAQVQLNGAMFFVVLCVVLARMMGKLGSILLLGHGTGLGWRRQWPVACAQLPLSGLALVLASSIAWQWMPLNPGVAQQVSAIALPLIVICELLGVLAASAALWRSGEAHRGIGRTALLRGEKRHDT